MYFGETLPGLNKSKANYLEVAKDYFYVLGAKENKKSVEITSHFDFGKADVKPEARQEILAKTQALIAGLNSDPSRVISIAGHTCDIGGYEYNIELSKQRARAVLEVLKSEGIEEK